MDNSRMAIIVLILIAVVFAIGVGAGFSRGADEPGAGKMDDDQIRAFVEKSVPGFFRSLQESIDFGARLKSEDFSYPKFKGSAVVIDFTAKEPLLALIGESGDENRKAVFKLVSGAGAFITYEPKSLPAGVEDPEAKAELRSRKLELLKTGDQRAGCGKNDKSCVEISIFKDGGTLIFECAGDQPCRVELK
ncbi:MAG TPA: hypothetical protein VFY40_06550 [Blastocatellia bacterium]|nr:hypothetical protein [Blastocatellia bacterium]